MGPDQELYVVLQRVADRLLQDAQSLLKGHGLSPQQYNVLRILRGAQGRLNCTEIANRMINVIGHDAAAGSDGDEGVD